MPLRSLIRALQRRWKLALSVFLATVAIGAVAVPSGLLSFSATARAALRPPSPAALEDRDTLASLLAGREVLVRVIQSPEFSGQFDFATPEELEKSVASLRSSLQARIEGRTALVTVRHLRPSYAVDRANALARAFEAVASEDHAKRVERALEAVERPLRDLSRTEADLAAALRSKEDPGAPAGGDAELRAARSRLAQLEETRAAAALEAGDLSANIDGLTRRIDRGEAGPAKALDTSESDRLASELDAARRRLESLRATYPDDFPPVARALAQVDDLRARHDRAVSREVLAARFAPLREALEEIRALSARRDRLRADEAPREARLTELRAEVQRLSKGRPAPAGEGEPRRVAEARFQASLEIRTALEARRAALLAERDPSARPVERVEAASEARASGASLLWVLAAGLVLALAFALAAESLATTLRTEHDVRRTVNLPLLGIVPWTPREEDRLLLAGDPRSPLTEVFHTTATLLESGAKENGAKVFGIVSASPGEGKSTVACNLALSLARAGNRVLLIDADLRRPAQHRLFNVANEAGLSSYLTGATDTVDGVLATTSVEALHLLPSGPALDNPGPYLRSERFRVLLPEFRARYDLILVDLPPVGTAADALVVAPLVEGILLVLSAPETRKDEAAQAKRLIRAAKGKLVGCVLNKATIRSRGYYAYTAAPAGLAD
jgi:capsular exopolysaccharide synthesis family protein